MASVAPFTPNGGIAASPHDLDNLAEDDIPRAETAEEDIPCGQPDVAASVEEHVPVVAASLEEPVPDVAASLEEHVPVDSREAAASESLTASMAPTVEASRPPSQQLVLPSPPVFRHAAMLPASNDWASEGMQLSCMTCNTLVHPHNRGVKLKSKTKMEYICSRCNCIATQMSYGLGSWPTEEFQGLEPETQLNFYKDDGNAAYKKRQYAMMCAKKRVERRVARDTGEMRPFEYWVRLGYCADRLRAHTPAKDKTFTDQAGEMCRVWVDTKICETEVLREMEEIMSKFKKRKTIKAEVKEVKEALKQRCPPVDDDAASSSSSDNSSSSSSSSSSNRKKRGAKKDKRKKAKAANAQEKEKKAAQKRKAEAKEDAKKSKLAHKQAEQSAKAMDKAAKAVDKAKSKKRDKAIDISGKALTRLQCLKSKLEGLLFEDQAGETIRAAVLENCPEFARTKGLQSYVTIRTMTELALQCLAEPTVEDIGYELDDVRSGEKDANEYINLLSSL